MYTTSTQNTPAQCIFNFNTSVTGYKKKGRSDFPRANDCQGQPKTPQSVSVVGPWLQAFRRNQSTILAGLTSHKTVNLIPL
jgi:hypothetical protein